MRETHGAARVRGKIDNVTAVSAATYHLPSLTICQVLPSPKAYHLPRLTICQVLAFRRARISRGWGKSKYPCNRVIEIAVRHSSLHSPKSRTARRKPRSIPHVLEISAS